MCSLQIYFTPFLFFILFFLLFTSAGLALPHMPSKRAASDAGAAPAQGEGLRALKRLDAGANKSAGGGADAGAAKLDAGAAKLLLDAWAKRQSAPRLLFRASQVVCCLLCSPAGVLSLSPQDGERV